MRRTFLTSALDMPEIMSYIYNKSWKLQFSASSSIIIIEDFYLQTFLHSLLCSFPSVSSLSSGTLNYIHSIANFIQLNLGSNFFTKLCSSSLVCTLNNCSKSSLFRVFNPYSFAVLDEPPI